MTQCAHDLSIECPTITEGRWMNCPVHKDRKTVHLRQLCLTQKKYRRRFAQAADNKPPRRRRLLTDEEKIVLRQRLQEDATEDMHDRLDRTLDRCFGGCKYFDGLQCRYQKGGRCLQRRWWREALLVFGCVEAKTRNNLSRNLSDGSEQDT